MKVENGNTVKVHYTGKLNDGTVFDSSVDKEPLEFTVGNMEMIQGFEEGVIGMEVGESKTIRIPADKAYGTYAQERVVVVNKENIPKNITLELGLELEIRQEDGYIIPVKIIEISESSVTLDANHPLSGKELVFDIEVLEINN